MTAEATTASRRKPIPLSVKVAALAAQVHLEGSAAVEAVLALKVRLSVKADKLAAMAKCTVCGDVLRELKLCAFDHRPALVARPWNARRKDFEPAQLDPNFIEAVHRSGCHDSRTFGRKPGAAKTVTTRGSDVGEAARTRRIAKSHQDFLASRKRGKAKRKSKVKRRWPSRPFNRSKTR